MRCKSFLCIHQPHSFFYVRYCLREFIFNMQLNKIYKIHMNLDGIENTPNAPSLPKTSNCYPYSDSVNGHVLPMKGITRHPFLFYFIVACTKSEQITNNLPQIKLAKWHYLRRSNGRQMNYTYNGMYENRLKWVSR